MNCYVVVMTTCMLQKGGLTLTGVVLYFAALVWVGLLRVCTMLFWIALRTIEEIYYVHFMILISGFLIIESTGSPQPILLRLQSALQSSLNSPSKNKFVFLASHYIS